MSVSWKSTLALLLCPPLLLSCGGGGDPSARSTRRETGPTPDVVRARPMPPLRVEEVPSSSQALRLEGDIEMRLDSVLVAGGDTLHAGDTLALATDTLSLLEAQRLRMEASLLMSVPEGADSVAADSLTGRAEELERPAAVTGGFGGVVTEVPVAAGDGVAPGDTLALVRSGSASTRALLPDRASLEDWPAVSGAGPVESTERTAVYSFPPQGRDSLAVGGLWLLRRDALRDRGLESFVVAGDDTVSVRRMGRWGDSIVVSGPLDGLELRTW